MAYGPTDSSIASPFPAARPLAKAAANLRIRNIAGCARAAPRRLPAATGPDREGIE